mgnify:CR=1 FL=1
MFHVLEGYNASGFGPACPDSFPTISQFAASFEDKADAIKFARELYDSKFDASDFDDFNEFRLRESFVEIVETTAVIEFRNHNARRLKQGTPGGGKVVDANPQSEYYREVLTPCCGAFSTFSDSDLVCRACYDVAEPGEGDGTEKVLTTLTVEHDPSPAGFYNPINRGVKLKKRKEAADNSCRRNGCRDTGRGVCADCGLSIE